MQERTGQPTDAPDAVSRELASVSWRTGWRGRAVWAAGLAVGAVVLSWCYILQARTQPATSDGAGIALQGWDMLHGNLLLRGWWTTDVSFYTFEVPLSALVIAVRGLSADAVHVTAGIGYALVVLVAALLGRGTARGREGVVRALLAAGIMIAPGLHEGTLVLLGSPDHVGVGVPILLTLLLIDRARERWWVPLAVLVLLLWAQLDDPVAEFAAAFPVALVCLVRAGVAFCRRRAWGYDAAVGVAAAVSYEFTQVAVHLIRAAGGYSMRSLSAVATIIPVSQWGTQLLHAGQNVLLLFGADYFWQQGGLLTAIAVVHIAGTALAFVGFLAGVAGLFRGADRVTQVLTVGLLATLGAGAFLTNMRPGYGAHDIIIALPFGAVLAGRVVGPWLRRRGLPQLALGSVLGVTAACYLAVLGYSASQPPVPAPTQSLAGFLASHGLTSGIGRYWVANITTAASDWHVRVIPASGGNPAQPYTWLARPSWYDPNKYSANFVVAGTNPASTLTYRASQVLRAFGPPAREYRFRGYVIMVYDRNLLSDVKPPVQPSPDVGSRLLSPRHAYPQPLTGRRRPRIAQFDEKDHGDNGEVTTHAAADRIRRRIGAAIFERVAGPPDPARRRLSRQDGGERWFTDDRPIRQVHGDSSMFIGGIRALLLQSLHPLAMAAVAGHSGYRGDPWGRLQRTSRFLGVTTFGGADAAREAIAQVRAVHGQVTGTAPDGRSYAASDPHLLTWVHLAEADSFLCAHTRFGASPLDQAGRDGYIADMAQIAVELGVPEPPRTEAELTERIAQYLPELAVTSQAREAARFLLLSPPLPLAARGPYWMLAAGAASMLPSWARQLLNLPRLPVVESLVVRPAGHAMVHTIRWATTAPAPDGPQPS